MDDEPALLRLLQEYLTRAGYEVDAYSSADEALAHFETRPDEYSLVLVDLTMPGMSGQELVLQLVRFNPRILVLLCSGYPFDVSGLPEDVRRQIRFLQKPFLPKMLTDEVEALLGRQ